MRVEGIEIDGSGLTNAPQLYGIYATDTLSTTSDVRIDSCIIHDLHKTTTINTYHYGIYIASTPTTGAKARISNNIVYDLTSPYYHVIGIGVWSPTSSYVYNNTVYNIKETKTGSPWGAAWGIAAFARIDCTNCNVWVYAKNNYVCDVIATSITKPAMTR